MLDISKELTVDDISLLMDSEPVRQVSSVDLDRELSSRSLFEFVKMAWPLVEPGRDFVSNWHIEAVCEHLEAAARGEIQRLVINQPPGTMKSLIAAVFFPTWMWTDAPETRFIYASYAAQVSRRDALRMRRIIESKWFKQRWNVTPDTDAWGATMFQNLEGGMRLSTSVGGGATSHHAHVQVADDPLKPFDVTGSMAVSSAALEKANTWWNETMSSRMVDVATGVRIIMMQRLHENDPAGAVLKAGGYEHLCLPMEAEGNRCKTSLGFVDPRKEGELLWPERFPKDAVERQKKELGSRAAAAQLQQHPSPAGGAVFKRAWIRHFDPEQWVAQHARAHMIQSWDMAFKSTDTSSYVVGQVWAHFGADFFLLDQVRERMSFSESCRAVVNMSKKWPLARSKIIEDKANGPAIADTLKKTLTGIVLVNPAGGKEARANAVEPLWEASNVHIPHPDKAPWVGDFIEELVVFPAGSHDDQVDAMTQALNRLQIRSMATYKQAMARLT